MRKLFNLPSGAFRMKIWKRYTVALLVTTVLTTLFTFFVYKHVKLKLKYSSHKHIYYPDMSLLEELAFNSNPAAKFYDLYDRSPLYDVLSELDRRAINGRSLTHFLERRDVIELHRKHNLNVGLSDLLPLNRPIPDSRPDG